jgi:hypothetical protein
MKTRRMRQTRSAACMEEIRNTKKILVGKPERRRRLERSRSRWEDNIKLDLKIGWEGVLWSHLAQN